MKRLRGLYIILIVAILATDYAHAGSKTYKRRVLVLDAINATGDMEVHYLSGSIAGALVGPLQKTGRFEIESRDLAKGLVKPGQTRDFTDKQAQEIGDEFEVDVVVTGRFVRLDTDISIETKAVDTKTGRVKVSESVRAKLDGSIFSRIKQLAAAMADNMARELPELQERPIYRSGQSAVDITVAPILALPRNELADSFKTGLGGWATVRYKGSWYGWWSLGFGAGFIQYKSSSRALNGLNQIPVQASFSLFQYFNRRLVLSESLSGGYTIGSLKGEGGSTLFYLPSAGFGLNLDYYLTKRLSFGLGVTYGFEFDSSLNQYLYMNTGMSYRL